MNFTFFAPVLSEGIRLNKTCKQALQALSSSGPLGTKCSLVEVFLLFLKICISYNTLITYMMCTSTSLHM